MATRQITSSKQLSEEFYPGVIYGLIGVVGGWVAMRLITRAGALPPPISLTDRLDARKTITINRSIVDVYQVWREGLREQDITGEKANDFLIWRTAAGALGETGGVAVFRRAPGARGTEIGIRLRYPSRFSKVERQKAGETVREQLRRLKQILETGEMATVEGQSRGGKR